MKCESCGYEKVDANDDFCSRCGYKIQRQKDIISTSDTNFCNDLNNHTCNNNHLQKFVDCSTQSETNLQYPNKNLTNSCSKPEFEQEESIKSASINPTVASTVVLNDNCNDSQDTKYRTKGKRIIKYCICILLAIILMVSVLFKDSSKGYGKLIVGTWKGIDRTGNEVSIQFNANKEYVISGLGLDESGVYELQKSGEITLYIPIGMIGSYNNLSLENQYRFRNKNIIVITDKDRNEIKLIRQNDTNEQSSKETDLNNGNNKLDNADSQNSGGSSNSSNLYEDEYKIVKDYISKIQNDLKDGKHVGYLTNLYENVYVYILSDENGIENGGEYGVGVFKITGEGAKELFYKEIKPHFYGFDIDINKVKDSDYPNMYIYEGDPEVSTIYVYIFKGENIEYGKCIFVEEDGVYEDIQYEYLFEEIKKENAGWYNDKNESIYNEKCNYINVLDMGNGRKSIDFVFPSE